MRIAALLFALPFALAPSASAEPIIEGCWGAAGASYCDPEVSVAPVQGDPRPTPICAGTCTYVGVPTLDTEDGYFEVCLRYTTPAGSPRTQCYLYIHPGGTVADPVGAACLALGSAPVRNVCD